MFEKRKLNKFKTKINNQSDKKIIEQLYLNSPDYMKNDKEICEIVFNKNKSLLKILPINFQLDKLKNDNLDVILLFAIKEAQIEFLKNNLSDSIITCYIEQLPEIITEYVINNISILNNSNINSNSINQLLNLLNKNNLLKEIINKNELVNNKQLIHKILENDNSLLREVSSEIRLDFFNNKMHGDGINLFKYLTEIEKESMFFKLFELYKFSENIVATLISSMDIETQNKIVLRDLKFLKYCNQEVQLKIFNNDSEMIKYLDENTKNVVLKSNPKLLYNIKNTSKASSGFDNSFCELKNISYSDLNIDDIISSPVFSAKGSLLLIASGGYDMLYGINQYSKSQYDFYQNMPEQQLSELCMKDINYILPVASVENKEQLENTRIKVKNIFRMLYGQELLNKYSATIDNIFNNYKFDHLTNPNCILDSLKIVFNKDIIEKNDLDIINYYIQTGISGVSNKDVFNMLITNAYGKNASDILKSRPNLNEHNINSLEIFNPTILEKFEVGLVHDLISYNISNMSYLLDIVKNSERLSNLSDLYKLESNIFGANITTFQRTLNDFVNMETLLKNIGEKELTEQELENLYSVVINRNYGNIRNKEELINYENKVKLRLLNEIKENEDIEYIKEKMCNAIFGINYNADNNHERLQMSAYQCSNIYEGSNAYNNELLSENEITMMNFLSIITHESSKDNIITILNNLFEEQNILGNLDFVNAISKIKDNQEKLLNDNLINVEKLEKELEKKSGLVYKTFRNGVPIYILNGIDFGTLTHNIGGTNNEYISEISKDDTLKKFDTLEEQFGSSTISTWYGSNHTYETWEFRPNTNSVCTIGYSNIPKDSIVGMDEPSNNGHDISTDHAPKLITSYAGGGIDFDKMYQESRKKLQEVSFYRKIREQSQITNENHGGRFDFDYFAGNVCIEDLTNIDNISLELSGDNFELYDEAQKRNIPIILVNTNAYSNKKEIVIEENIERGITK